MNRNNYGFFLEKVLSAPFNCDYCYSINQNLVSLSLHLKGIFYNNASILFLTSIFNLFQVLDAYTSENKICYESYSQALTTYFLKCCDRMGIIKIISCEQDGEMPFESYYKELNNNSKKYFHKVYDVKFIKIRPFNQDDINEIKAILRFLKIDEDNLVFKINNSKLKLNVNSKLIINNIISSDFKSNLKEFFINYFQTIPPYIEGKLLRKK